MRLRNFLNNRENLAPSNCLIADPLLLFPLGESPHGIYWIENGPSGCQIKNFYLPSSQEFSIPPSFDDFKEFLNEINRSLKKEEPEKKLGVDHSIPYKYISYLKKINQVELLHLNLKLEEKDIPNLKKNYHHLEMATVYGIGKIREGANADDIFLEMKSYYEGQQIKTGIDLSIKIRPLSSPQYLSQEILELGDKPCLINLHNSLQWETPRLNYSRQVIWKGIEEIEENSFKTSLKNLLEKRYEATRNLLLEANRCFHQGESLKIPSTHQLFFASMKTERNWKLWEAESNNQIWDEYDVISWRISEKMSTKETTFPIAIESTWIKNKDEWTLLDQHGYEQLVLSW